MWSRTAALTHQPLGVRNAHSIRASGMRMGLGYRARCGFQGFVFPRVCVALALAARRRGRRGARHGLRCGLAAMRSAEFCNRTRLLVYARRKRRPPSRGPRGGLQDEPPALSKIRNRRCVSQGLWCGGGRQRRLAYVKVEHATSGRRDFHSIALGHRFPIPPLGSHG